MTPGPALPEFWDGNWKIWDEKGARCLQGHPSRGLLSPSPSLMSRGQRVPWAAWGGNEAVGVPRGGPWEDEDAAKVPSCCRGCEWVQGETEGSARASLAVGTPAAPCLGGQRGHRQQCSDETLVLGEFPGRGERDVGKGRVSLCSVQGKQQNSSSEGADISSAAAFGDERVPGLVLGEL